MSGSTSSASTFAVLYGSRTLTTTAIKDAEVRQVACRALNAFNAAGLRALRGSDDAGGADSDAHTRRRRSAELDHAVGRARVPRHHDQRPGAPADWRSGRGGQKAGLPNWGSGSDERMDCLGLDSAYDYDPFWRRCIELKVVARVAHARHGLGQPPLGFELHVESHRLVRREHGGAVPLALHGRRHAALPGAGLRHARGWRQLGLPALRRHHRPLGEAQPARRSAPSRSRADRHRR